MKVKLNKFFQSGNTARVNSLLTLGQQYYNVCGYANAKQICEQVCRAMPIELITCFFWVRFTSSLETLARVCFYNQQAIRVNPHFAEAFWKLGQRPGKTG